MATGAGKAYEIGPDQEYKRIVDMPWEYLGPGDTVRIHWRPEPYKERILVSSQGTELQPIRICGVRGPDGQLPVIDGQGAISRGGAPFHWSGDSKAGVMGVPGRNTQEGKEVGTQDRGLLVLSFNRNKRSGDKPRYILIEGLELRGAYSGSGEKDSQAYPGTFTDHNGNERHYTSNAAGIFVERGEHLIIRGNVLRDNGNGFFIASGDDEDRLCTDILFEGNVIYGNGVIGGDRSHNSYSECIGMTYAYNFFGRQRPGAKGNNLKDRSAGTMIRFNWFEGGAHMNDLVEREDGGPVLSDHPSYRDTYVIGNHYVNDQALDQGMRLIHYGGDNHNYSIYRKGTLHFERNTIAITSTNVSKRWTTVVFDASTQDESIDARDNVIYHQGTAHLNLLEVFGKLDVSVGNCVSSQMPLEDFYNSKPEPVTGTIIGKKSIRACSPAAVARALMPHPASVEDLRIESMVPSVID